MCRLAVLSGLLLVGAISLAAAVEQARKDGKTADQAAAELKLLEKYKDYNMGRLKANFTAIYSELK